MTIKILSFVKFALIITDGGEITRNTFIRYIPLDVSIQSLQTKALLTVPTVWETPIK